MSTLYVPALVVLAKADYDRLVAHFETVELPADIRQILTENRWTQESIMLGQVLAIAAKGLDTPST